MSQPRDAKPCALAHHVRACAVGRQVVLLDLRHDRYLAVPQQTPLCEQIDGWPACTEPAAPPSSRNGQLLATLLEQGLLTRGGRAQHDRTLPRPARSIDTRQAADLGLVRGLAVLASAVSHAALTLRFRDLAAIATALAARRGRFGGACSEVEACGLAARYAELRPIVFGPRDRCLLDSLALANFLAHWRLAPTFVIGVRTRPFAAHAWVQAGPIVLNDRHEHVAQYQPLLVV